MSRYEEGIKLIEESCGNGKDNVIALSTVVMEPNADGMPSSCVRDVAVSYTHLDVYKRQIMSSRRSATHLYFTVIESLPFPIL